MSDYQPITDAFSGVVVSGVGVGAGWTRAGLVQPAFPRGGWCTVCGRGFTSDSADAVHRVGGFGKGRRCRDDDELVAKGLVLRDSGLWGLPPREGGWDKLSRCRGHRQGDIGGDDE